MNTDNLPPLGDVPAKPGKGACPAAAFPAKAEILGVDYRSRIRVWVPAFAGKADRGWASATSHLHRYAAPLPHRGRIEPKTKRPRIAPGPSVIRFLT